MPWDHELSALERAIRDLNAEYDVFLYGSGGKPPLESRRHVERMIRYLSGSEADSAADEYRFSTLQGRYSALCERWDRLQEEKESGNRRPGLYGHFLPDAAPGGSASGSRRAAPLNDSSPSSVDQVQRTQPVHSPDRDLFEKYVSAKKARGESVAGYDFARFVQGLRLERERLRERMGSVAIDFDIVERDGKVKLVARKRS